MIVDSHELSFNIREGVESDLIVIREILEENVYEVNVDRFLLGGKVIDVGSNIGVFSIYAASLGAEVISVEPEPNNLDLLKSNIALNNLGHLIEVCDLAISDYAGTALIGDDGGDASIFDNLEIGVEIKVITLDTLFDIYDVSEVSVLKIDAEGSELPMILGASQKTLNKCKYITIEFDKRTGWHMGSIVAKLSETHHVRTMGSWERGGMIWAWLY